MSSRWAAQLVKIDDHYVLVWFLGVFGQSTIWTPYDDMLATRCRKDFALCGANCLNPAKMEWEKCGWELCCSMIHVSYCFIIFSGPFKLELWEAETSATSGLLACSAIRWCRSCRSAEAHPGMRIQDAQGAISKMVRLGHPCHLPVYDGILCSYIIYNII